MDRSRIVWIDISKGITILLMVAGHTSIPHWLSNFIWAFHMPLFFIASGWCTDWYKQPFVAFLMRKVKSLLISFIVYSFAVIILASIIHYEEWSLISILKNGWGGYALWFIPVLFLSLIVSKLVLTIHNKWLQLVASLSLLVIGVSLRYYCITLPWNVCSVPYATFLVILGSWMKNYSSVIENIKWWFPSICFIITLLVSQNWRLDIAWNHIIPVSFLTVGAISGTLMIFTLSSIICRISEPISKLLQSVGRETFIILAFSQVLGPVIQFVIPCNKIVEYLLAFSFLIMLAVLKNGVNKLCGFKLFS